ncbi:MAG: DUF1592 domain-containing protein [Bryobacterales bacterium]|nr:DUF1592 domain-containing protein [Bryobacterales bacterium]
MVLRFVVLAGATAVAASAAVPLAAEFERDIQPVVAQYCLVCHSAAKHAGDLNLERYNTFAAVMNDPKPWQKAVEQLTLGEMPPKGMPPLPAAEKTQLLAWIQGAVQAAGQARAGDPGPVVLRRLNNAEYTYTVRDLTRVASLDPVREFPADGAAGEGFMNTGGALAMSPALLSKYLDAAKSVAAHAVLLPNGVRFSKSTSRSDWTGEILSEIRAFYAAHTADGGADTVTQQGIALDKNRGGTLPLDRYLRASLGAREEKLSPKYLASLTALLRSPRPSPLLDDLRADWRKAKLADVPKLLAQITPWQNTLWKFSSVGHIGKQDGPKAWMEPVTPIVDEQPFRVKLGATRSDTITLYLVAHDAGDGAANDTVRWREPQLAIPGRAPVMLRDLPALVDELTAQRTRIFAATARALNAATPGNVAEKAWLDFVRGNGAAPKLDLLTKKIDKLATFDFVQGWGAASTPMVIANASAQTVRVPGTMKAHSVAVHPSATLQVAVGWRSPVDAMVRVETALQRAHPECGNGTEWSLELRRGGARVRRAQGDHRQQPPALESIRVERGDLLSILVGPREGNHSCDLTAVDVTIAARDGARWSLANDVSGSVLAGNPHGGVWHFYTEPAATATGMVLSGSSLLGRWLVAEPGEARRALADQLQRLLVNGAAAGNADDTALYRQLASLAGPLFAGVTATARAGDSPDIVMQAPAMREVRLPADLVAGSEFVTTGTVEGEGTVQLEILTSKPAAGAQRKLLPAGTTVADGKGMWTSNNQTVAYALPVVARTGTAARRRVEQNFDEFRQMFPASLCYTKIVPVDEVVTLTLYHREDDHLSRLVLDARQKAQLDRLWDELHFVSRDALTLVDAFEQLWQYATQDADPSKFEPLRQPILARAAAFREQVKAAEPRHVDAVVEFAGRAYRRPLAEADRAQLRALYQQLRTQELPHEEAVRLLLARVLVSPSFLYKTENAGPGRVAKPVNDYELASRLSYFLWSSQPDAALLAAAGAGKLRTAAGLQAEARRMLRDNTRVRRLATEFGAAWLHIYDFDSLDEKSERHFPTFRSLRGDMYEESIRFLSDLFSANRSVLSILDADHTFLNEALAKHYAIPGVAGTDWRRVEGVKQYGRGGVLGQASVLAKQAGASRTSPILRGHWISEVLLGDKLPRPPKDVPQLPTDEAAETLSVRELTERHTKDPRCSGCHARVDPYGYTLERFDAIGRRREQDLGNRPVNDRSVLRDGTPVDGADGLRAYLLGKGRPTFVRQFCRKLLGYALGRSVELSDEPLLNTMQAQLAANGYHVGTVVDLIVTSRQFREIRGRDHESEIH